MVITPHQDPLLQAVPTIDGYKVLEPAVLVEKLPEGGMAAVYRGLHLDLKVDVAVKVLKRGGDLGYSPQAVARFRQEAEQAARLNDPNLVRIYDFPASRIGLLYLVMEYVDGETLEARVQRKGRLGPHEAVTVAYHAARGLQAAHAEHVIHRDIKPPNILISKRGHVKVTDLGIAKATDSAAMGMTQEITLLGTPQYMAPELWRGARFASPASDVFAVGATVAFMLTGRHVLDGGDAQEIMHRTLTEGFPDVARLAPGVPPPLADLVRHCTRPNPAERIGVDDLILLLRELLDGFHGEFPLADPKAGATMQAVQPARLPSRADLTRIREYLDSVQTPGPASPLPGTLRVRDDPATVVAQAAAAGRVNLYGTKAVGGAAATMVSPARALVRPPPRRKKRKAGRRLALLAFLGAIGGGGWYAYQQGWLKPDKLLAFVRGDGGGGPTPATQPGATTRLASAADPATRTAGPTTGTVRPPPPEVPATKPAPPENPLDSLPSSNDPTTKPLVERPPERPPEPPQSRPVDPPPPPPVRLTAYESAKKGAIDAAAAGTWSVVLAQLAAARPHADAESKRADFVESADGLLMQFRAANADLDRRRRDFPALPRGVGPVEEAGSGAASLVAAEASLVVRGEGAARRLDSNDVANGFTTVITHLERAAAREHAQAAADAKGYLFDARLAQVDFLGDKARWAELLAWLPQLPVAKLKGSADPASRAMLARSVEAASRQLLALWQAKPEPAQVQGLGRDLDVTLAPLAEAGSQVAALLVAESLIGYDAKRVLTGVKPGALPRVVAMCEQARTAGGDPRVAAAATGYLLEAYGSAAAGASDRKAWAEAIASLGRGQALLRGSGLSPPQQAQLAQKWRAMADASVQELRRETPDLDRRREAFPELGKDLAPLADAGVYAARLALAEQTIGYEGDPPRAAPRQNDADFAVALRHLAACISSADCPEPIKQAALYLEWDVFAAFARRSAADPRRASQLVQDLGKLARCGGNPARERDYAALVDELLKPDNPDRAMLRVQLAEDRLGVDEDARTGLRLLKNRDPALLAGLRPTLEGTLKSANPDARARAGALLGEIVALDRSPKAQAEAYVLFRDAAAKKDRNKLGDPVALMGLARFYQLGDAELAPLAAENPAVADVQKLDVARRQAAVMSMYRDAAFSGDPFANFCAGRYTWEAFNKDATRKREAETYLAAAAAKGHRMAKTELARVRAGR